MPEIECYASKWNAFHLLENKDAQEPLFFNFFFSTLTPSTCPTLGKSEFRLKEMHCQVITILQNKNCSSHEIQIF